MNESIQPRMTAPAPVLWQATSPVAETTGTQVDTALEPLVSAARQAVEAWDDSRGRVVDEQAVVEARMAAMAEALSVELLLVAPDPEEIAVMLLQLDAQRKQEKADRGKMLSAVKAVVSSPEGDGAYRALIARGEFSGIPGLIEAAEGNLLEPIEGALAEYMKLLEQIMSVMADLSKYIQADTDNVTIKAAFAELLKGLPSFPLLASFDNEKAAQDFIDALGLPGLYLVKSPPSGYFVRVDMAPFKTIIDGFPGDLHKDDLTLSNAAFQAWVNGKDSVIEQFQHISQVMAQHLSRQNQFFSDFTGALSKGMERLLQMMMSFINGISS